MPEVGSNTLKKEGGRVPEAKNELAQLAMPNLEKDKLSPGAELIGGLEKNLYKLKSQNFFERQDYRDEFKKLIYETLRNNPQEHPVVKEGLAKIIIKAKDPEIAESLKPFLEQMSGLNELGPIVLFAGKAPKDSDVRNQLECVQITNRLPHLHGRRELQLLANQLSYLIINMHKSGIIDSEVALKEIKYFASSNLFIGPHTSYARSFMKNIAFLCENNNPSLSKLSRLIFKDDNFRDVDRLKFIAGISLETDLDAKNTIIQSIANKENADSIKIACIEKLSKSRSDEDLEVIRTVFNGKNSEEVKSSAWNALRTIASFKDTELFIENVRDTKIDIGERLLSAKALISASPEQAYNILSELAKMEKNPILLQTWCDLVAQTKNSEKVDFLLERSDTTNKVSLYSLAQNADLSALPSLRQDIAQGLDSSMFSFNESYKRATDKTLTIEQRSMAIRSLGREWELTFGYVENEEIDTNAVKYLNEVVNDTSQPQALRNESLRALVRGKSSSHLDLFALLRKDTSNLEFFKLASLGILKEMPEDLKVDMALSLSRDTKIVEAKVALVEVVLPLLNQEQILKFLPTVIGDVSIEPLIIFPLNKEISDALSSKAGKVIASALENLSNTPEENNLDAWNKFKAVLPEEFRTKEVLKGVLSSEIAPSTKGGRRPQWDVNLLPNYTRELLIQETDPEIRTHIIISLLKSKEKAKEPLERIDVWDFVKSEALLGRDENIDILAHLGVYEGQTYSSVLYQLISRSEKNYAMNALESFKHYPIEHVVDDLSSIILNGELYDRDFVFTAMDLIKEKEITPDQIRLLKPLLDSPKIEAQFLATNLILKSKLPEAQDFVVNYFLDKAIFASSDEGRIKELYGLLKNISSDSVLKEENVDRILKLYNGAESGEERQVIARVLVLLDNPEVESSLLDYLRDDKVEGRVKGALIKYLLSRYEKHFSRTGTHHFGDQGGPLINECSKFVLDSKQSEALREDVLNGIEKLARVEMLKTNKANLFSIELRKLASELWSKDGEAEKTLSSLANLACLRALPNNINEILNEIPEANRPMMLFVKQAVSGNPNPEAYYIISRNAENSDEVIEHAKALPLDARLKMFENLCFIPDLESEFPLMSKTAREEIPQEAFSELYNTIYNH